MSQVWDEDRIFNLNAQRIDDEETDIRVERKKVKINPVIRVRRIKDKLPTPRLHVHRPKYVEGCESPTALGIPVKG
jgi:hypothetical protein